MSQLEKTEAVAAMKFVGLVNLAAVIPATLISFVILIPILRYPMPNIETIITHAKTTFEFCLKTIFAAIIYASHELKSQLGLKYWQWGENAKIDAKKYPKTLYDMSSLVELLNFQTHVSSKINAYLAYSNLPK